MNPLAIFSGPYALLAKWGVIVLVLAAAFGSGWIKGNEHGTQKLIDYQGKQAIETVRVAAERVKVVTQVETKWRTKIETVTVQGATIEKEVVKYVTSTDDAGCTIPAGFVREHTAAWTNTPAGPPEDADRRPSGIPLSAAAEAEARNATACLTFKAQRDGLIETYRKLQDVK